MPPHVPNGCPNCKSTAFTVDKDLVAMPKADLKSGELDTSKGFVVGAVTCTQCGMALLFNINVAGDIREGL